MSNSLRRLTEICREAVQLELENLTEPEWPELPEFGAQVKWAAPDFPRTAAAAKALHTRRRQLMREIEQTWPLALEVAIRAQYSPETAEERIEALIQRIVQLLSWQTRIAPSMTDSQFHSSFFRLSTIDSASGVSTVNVRCCIADETVAALANAAMSAMPAIESMIIASEIASDPAIARGRHDNGLGHANQVRAHQSAHSKKKNRPWCAAAQAAADEFKELCDECLKSKEKLPSRGEFCIGFCKRFFRNNPAEKRITHRTLYDILTANRSIWDRSNRYP